MTLTRDRILSEVQEAFGSSQRPDMFIRGTCCCDECQEHEAVMQDFDPVNLPLDRLDNPGWDPICFASNHAFAYLMPGLVKLVLDHPQEYIQQCLFHLEQPERIAGYTAKHARALMSLLDHLVLNEVEALDENRLVDELFRTREALEGVVTGR